MKRILLHTSGLVCLVFAMCLSPVLAQDRPSLQFPPEEAVFQVSAPVAKDGLEYQVLYPPVLAMPDRKGLTPLELGLRVTNRGKKSVQYFPERGMPLLKSADGKLLKIHAWGCDHYRGTPGRVSIQPLRPFSVIDHARLYGTEKGALLTWEDDSGFVWSYDDLSPGKYFLSLDYTTWDLDPKDKSYFSVQTKEVPVELREMKTSKKIAFPEYAVSALADATWEAPAGGKQGPVGLGFRIARMDKSESAGIGPTISKIRLTSSNGRHFDSTRTGDRIARRPLVPCMTRPEISFTYLEPAILLNTGRSLSLLWVDADGNLLQVQGLQPGKYGARYSIQGLHAKMPYDRLLWHEEMQTAELTLQIQ
jgi:hypothetical protein